MTITTRITTALPPSPAASPAASPVLLAEVGSGVVEAVGIMGA